MTAAPSPPRYERVKVADLRDGGAQARIEIKEATVADYAADMASGTVFPPVVAYFDGQDLWLADGFHRVRAARAIDRDEIASQAEDWEERAGDLWSEITDDLESSRPDLKDFPKPEPRPADEPDDVLFDSGRDYLTQLDHFRDWQGRNRGGNNE